MSYACEFKYLKENNPKQICPLYRAIDKHRLSGQLNKEM